jgi:four helix bundle protein
MTKEELKQRTKKFALMVIKLISELPNNKAGNAIGNQLIRSGTSVASNYRASCRARSPADFVSKLTIVEEECDESLFWLELITESGLLSSELTKQLMTEANELTAIFTAAGKTVKENINSRKNRKRPLTND